MSDRTPLINEIDRLRAENAALREFVAKIATKIEPLNSIVGYRNKDDRAHFAAQLRREASALLAEKAE